MPALRLHQYVFVLWPQLFSRAEPSLGGIPFSTGINFYAGAIVVRNFDGDCLFRNGKQRAARLSRITAANMAAGKRVTCKAVNWIAFSVFVLCCLL